MKRKNTNPMASGRIAAVAAIACRLDRELHPPCPDYVMRRIYTDQLRAAVAALSVEERIALDQIADRPAERTTS